VSAALKNDSSKSLKEARRFGDTEAFDCAAEFMRGDAGVALGGVEVLVTEELLDLPEVRAGAEELGCEHVAKRMRRDPLTAVMPTAHA
jgi:hypothetical protein